MYEIEKSRRTPHGVKTKRDRHSLSVTVNIVAVVTIFLLSQTPTFVSAVVMKGKKDQANCEKMHKSICILTSSKQII